MGFSQQWSTNKAFDIVTGEIVTLPEKVRVCLLDKKSVLYAIPVSLPHGLSRKPGQVLVCESHDGGVSLKGFRFQQEGWEIDFLGGGIHLDSHAGLIKVCSPESSPEDTKWIPAPSEAWRNPGTELVFGLFSDVLSPVGKNEGVGFQEFMNKHWPSAESLVYPAQD